MEGFGLDWEEKGNVIGVRLANILCYNASPNKLAQTKWLTTEIYFLVVLEARSPKSVCCWVSFLLRPLPGLQVTALLIPLHIVIPLFMTMVSFCPNLLFLQGHLSDQMKAHPPFLILT